MSKRLTTQQQSDLATWEQDPSQKLPESLQNVFIEDCLEELKNNEEARNRFAPLTYFYYENETFGVEGKSWSDISLEPSTKIIIIQTLLSRTSYGGQAVMPFLDVETDPEDMMSILDDLEIPSYLFTDIVLSNLQLTLVLFFAFLLSEGNSFDEALEVITKIYILNIYV